MNKDGASIDKIKKIEKTITLKQGPKKSKKGEAMKQILKNLQDFLNDFPEERQEELNV